MGPRIHSFKQAAFWSTAIGAFSQGLALLFGMVMAALFGAQESTDVLYYCIGVFVLLAGILQVANVNVLIPETMRRRIQSGELDAMAFINRFFAVFALIILVLTVWIMSDPTRILTLISQFSEEALDRNSQLVIWLVVSMPLQMAAQLLLDILVSYKFLTLPATLSCVSRIINLIFVWRYHQELGVVSVALGMVLGFGLQVILNLYLLRRIIHWNFFAWKTRIGKTVYQNIAWAELGILASTLARYLPLFLFSGFSAGALTTLNYAKRLCLIPTQMLTVHVSNVAGIKFNELVARSELVEAARSFNRLCRLLIFGMVPLAFAFLLARNEIVTILLGRGDFTPKAAAEVSALFGILILALPFEAMNTMVARYFIARQAISQALPLQITGALLNAGMVFISVRLWGPIGFPVGILQFWILYFLVLAVVMPRLFKTVFLWPILGSWVRTMMASGVVAGAVWSIGSRTGFQEWNPWLSASCSVMLFIILYGGWLLVFPPDREALQYARTTARQLRKQKGRPQ